MTWTRIGSCVVGLCLVLTGCSGTTTGRPAAAPDLGHWQPAPVLSERLGDLLLGTADVNAVGHTTAMTLRVRVTEMSHSEGTVSDPNCLHAYSPIQTAAYRGSSWTAVQGQLLDDAPSSDAPFEHALLQAVVGFRDADSARQFFSQAASRWLACANRPLTVQRPHHEPVTWAFGELMSSQTTLRMMQSRADGDIACERAVALVNNVVVDTLWCGSDTTDQAGQVITKIAAGLAQPA